MILILLAMAGIACSTHPASAQPKPDAPGPVLELPNDTILSMSRAWDRLRNPRMLIVVGTVRNNRVVYDAPDSNADRLVFPFREQIMRACPNGLVSATVAALQEANHVDRLRRESGAHLDAGAARALCETFKADILIDIVLLPGERPGELTPTMLAVDTRTATEFASSKLLSVNFAADPRLGHAFGARLAKDFSEGLIRIAGADGGARPADTFTIRVVTRAGEEGVGTRELRRISRDIEEEVKGVSWSEIEGADEGGATANILKIRYAGRLRDLLDDIEDRVLNDKSLGWNVVSTAGTTAAAFLYRAQRPKWHTLTDPADPAYGQRRARLNTGAPPTLGVVVGSNVASPADIFGVGGEAPGLGFDDSTLHGALTNQFSDMGFRVADAGATARLRDRSAANAERYENLSHLGAAIRELHGVDYVLYVNVGGTGPGRQLDATMFDVKSGLVVGQERWPSLQATRLSGFAVDGRAPEEVSRFLAGRIIERWDRHQTKSSTIEVQVRNVTDAQEVIAISEAMASLPGITTVADLTFSSPAAGFEVVTAENPITILPRLMDVIGVWRPGTEIQVDGRTIILNLVPKVKPEGEPAAQVAAGNPSAAKGAAVGSIEGVAAAVARIRDSVCVVGIGHKGQFHPLGTAWVVSGAALATNAHVVVGLYSNAAALVTELKWEPADVRFIARRGPSQEHELILGRTWVHPKYLEEARRREGYLREMLVRQGLDPASQEGQIAIRRTQFAVGYDLGLLEVTSGVIGEPLEILTGDAASGLAPPMPVGYAGFPMENIANAADRPVMATNVGWLSAVTGFDLLIGAPQNSYLLHYDLLTAGGASGSPVVDARGRVVGVNFAGSYITGAGKGLPRIRRGVAYARRADLGGEMLIGQVQEVTWSNILQLFGGK